LASGKAKQSPSNWITTSLGVAVAGTAGFLGYSYLTSNWKDTWIDSQLPKNEVVDINDLRADFIQEKRSLKSPGVYTWGSNEYKVVDPGSKDTDIKSPRRFKYFNGQVLRDFKVDEKSGAAITEDGDLVQWGKGFSETEYKPSKTLTGKNLISLALSESRLIALSSAGNIYSVPISKSEQTSGPKTRESSWVPLWGGKSALSYRILKPALKLGEKVTAISGGQEHVVILTSSGRVFTAASSTEKYPSLGQLGVPGLTWTTRPSGPADQCHEVTTLKGSKVTQIASGDYHSLALTKDGRLFAWGDNSFGQLGVEYEPSAPFKDTPFTLPAEKYYRKALYSPTITSVAAGGATTFYTVDSKRILGSEEDPTKVRDLGTVTAETWSCGRGIWGTLGAGKWIHIQDSPTKVKDLSGLGEYDEKMKQLAPIRLRHMSVGTNHAAAVLDNKTTISGNNIDSLDKSKDFGYEVFWWGGNEHFQLGTGKRSNQSRPTHIKAPPESKKPEPEARLQIMPRHKGPVGKRTKSMEQRVECGRHVSAIYSSV
jgi:alpha-tubulin suppressor-like RCC1 family protein